MFKTSILLIAFITLFTKKCQGQFEIVEKPSPNLKNADSSFTDFKTKDLVVLSTLSEVVLSQNLIGVDCNAFKNVSNAQSIFVQAVEQVLSAFSANGIKAVIKPNGINCGNSSGAVVRAESIKFAKPSFNIIPIVKENNRHPSLLNVHETSLPSINIEYLLSWVVGSGDVALLNVIYGIVTKALADAISSAQFDSILQTIAHQNNVTILLSASSSNMANITSLTISILDTATASPSISNATKKNLKSNQMNGYVKKIVIGVVSSFALIVLILFCLYYYIYHMKATSDKADKFLLNYDIERGLTDPSSKQLFGGSVNDITISCKDIDDRSTLFTTRSSEIKRMQIGKFSHFIGYGKDLEGGESNKYADRNSYNLAQKMKASPMKRVNSPNKKYFTQILVPEFEWSDIELKGTTLAEAVIGKGSFGSVVLARLSATNEDEQLITTDDVVVKVMTKSLGISRDLNTYQKNLTIAIQEASVLMDAESKIVYKDCIIKVYGIASGSLSQQLCETLNVSEEATVVGIVMRLESGGSLDALIHPKPVTTAITTTTATAITGSNSHITDTITSKVYKLDMKDKLRLLTGIARGLAELHTAGIVHGDIKPDNVLLSSKDYTTAEVRLADFGLAAVREQNSAVHSSLAETAHFRGTPLYCAPEMLIDPYAEIVNDKVARPSRKTDVYAFAILAWEVLTEKKPFSDIKNESVLCMKVHQGYRPSPDDFPDNVPNKIKNLIIACWDTKRHNRRSAIECYSIFKHYHGLMVNTNYDVYLTYHFDQQIVANYIFNRMSQRGLNVCFVNKSSPTSPMFSDIDNIDSTINTNSIEHSQKQNIIVCASRAKTVVACINQVFQNDESCLNEIKEARKMKKHVVPLFTESNFNEWINGDIDYACQMKDAATVVFDASLAVNDDSWISEDGPIQSVIHKLNQEVDKLTEHLLTQIKTEHF